MRLLSQRPGALTGVDLGAGIWRLLIVEGIAQGKPALELALRFPPAVPFAISPAGQVVGYAEYQQVVLAAVRVEIAQQAEELKRIAAVALVEGTREGDRKRTEEAFALFKNLPRLRNETYEACLADALKLVDGYWNLAAWILDAQRSAQTWEIGDARVQGAP